MVVPETKMIDGRLFGYRISFLKKSQAQKRADNYRKIGHKVRVIRQKVHKKMAYSLYLR